MRNYAKNLHINKAVTHNNRLMNRPGYFDKFTTNKKIN